MAVAGATIQQTRITRAAVSMIGTDEEATLEQTSEFVVTVVVVTGREVEVFGYPRTWVYTARGEYQERVWKGKEEPIWLHAEPDHDLGDGDWWWEAGFEVAKRVGVDRTVLDPTWRLWVEGRQVTGEE